MRISTRLVIAALALSGVAVAGGLWLNARRSAPEHYATAPASVGRVSREITASGAVNPVVTVQVGAFVSGNIQTLACDFNTRVVKGQVCATLDPRPYQLTLDQARAALDSAKAQTRKDQATLEYAGLSYARAQKLAADKWVSQDAVDNAAAARDAARAQVAVDVATVAQRQAAVNAAAVNLGYTRILSPVDGTVVSRNVNTGQTVAASFQTPTLFLIAKDLTKMQVDTNVSESDIAGAAVGAEARFSVEAFPGREFRGRVVQVRQAPVSVQNVITYDVVIAADNPGLLLKPGMTATAKIVVASRDHVLRAPVQALHFTPASQARPHDRSGPPQVWVLRDGKPVATPVSVGVDDGTFAEITGGGLRAGDMVIVSTARQPRRAAQPSPMRFGQ